MYTFTIDTYRELAPHDRQEWLLTNGSGGFASSTIVGMNTRRYHGLLVAATLPPVGRVMTVNRIAETLTVDGLDMPAELSVNCFPGLIHPRGDRFLTRFELGDTARWTFDVAGVSVVKELELRAGNVAAVRYTVDAGDRAFKLSLSPFLGLRDFHSLRKVDGTNFGTEGGYRRIVVSDGQYKVVITSDAGTSDAGTFVEGPDWWHNHLYPVETERGQDDTEDLYTPGAFVLDGTGTATVSLSLTLESEATIGDSEPATVQGEATPPGSTVVARLFRAAGDFVVARKTPDGRPGTTIIAGYPWFADWGRDTMISLPGLLLVTGKFERARQVLTVFAEYVSEGMIPNRFDDYTSEPEYNTVDASLWFIHAVHEYVRLSGDRTSFDQTLRPACQKIIDGYRDGTRYHIKMDPADGLISQGDAQTQLTWMDAKCNGVAFTPRQGKPVEINALWYHALVLMNEMELAAQVADSFKKVFWIDDTNGLADVVDGDRRDTAVRPNQIFAVSLPNSPLTADQQKAVVAVVARELLTPVGLRTLNRTDPGYRGRYTGDQFNRDGAYHNGTVWPWLIGPFLEAHIKVNHRSAESIEQAREWLTPLIAYMSDTAVIGQISEIFEGDAPHRPVGCPAQAWSVAEVLRMAVELGM